MYYHLFQMAPANLERSCDHHSVCFSPSPMFSPTNSFLQLSHAAPARDEIFYVSTNTNTHIYRTQVHYIVHTHGKHIGMHIVNECVYIFFNIQPGDKVEITAESTFLFNTFHLVVSKSMYTYMYVIRL